MEILVAYATRHGATAGIAERIAAVLTGSGLPTEARAVEEVPSVDPYDAVVLGGAAYMFHWLKEASAFIDRNRRLLAERPVWLFSSGPLGTDPVNEKGEDQLVVSVPKEFPRYRAELHPRGEQVFFGALDPSAQPIGVAERLMHLMPAARDALPHGDFRDWPAIDAWADGIAADLLAAPATGPGSTPASAAAG